MPTHDVTIFNVSADEPDGTNLSVQVQGAAGVAAASAPSSNQQSNPANAFITGAAGLANPGKVDGTTDNLTQGSTNLFLDPDNGNDSYDGEWAAFNGGTQGPKKTWAGIKALNLANYTGIYMKVGTTTTGEQFWNQTAFRGTSANRAVIGAYYFSVSGTPFRGLGGNDRPIIQGTSSPPHDFLGNNTIPTTSMFPQPETIRINFTGLIGLDADGSNYWLRVENLRVQHSGGMGIRYSLANQVEVVNCHARLCLGPGIQCRRGNGYLVEDNIVTGCGGGQDFIGFNDHPAIISMNRVSNAIVRRNIVSQNWGECIDFFDGCEQFLIEDNVVIDSKQPHYYFSAAKSGVVRRNMSIQSNRLQASPQSRNSATSDAGPSYYYQGAETSEIQPVGSNPSSAKTKDIAVYTNFAIAGREALRFNDQHGRDYDPDADFNSAWIYRNTFIDCDQVYSRINTFWTASDGKILYNLHLTYADNVDDMDDIDRGTWEFNHNGWNASSVPTLAQTWTDNITDMGFAGDTTGFRTLYTLGTYQSDDEMTETDLVAFVAAVKAKLGAVTGTGVNVSADAVPEHPSAITLYAYEDVDFFGNPWSTNDLGAVAA